MVTFTYLQLRKSDYFDSYYHVYKVVCTNVKHVINVDLIPRVSPCTYVVKNSEEFISLRYDV